jgi:integrase
MLPVENTRTGFFTVAEVKALLEQLDDADVRNFIEWAFRTGMRRGEIGKLEWSMLDQSGSPWVPRIPGTITKNAKGRSFGFDGEALAIMKRRVQARRLDCPLVFHRAGRVMGPFRDLWRSAVKAAGLPPGGLFHDLRRTAVRNLIHSGMDQTTAMKVSGHRTDQCSGDTTSSRNPRPQPPSSGLTLGSRLSPSPATLRWRAPARRGTLQGQRHTQSLE